MDFRLRNKRKHNTEGGQVMTSMMIPLTIIELKRQKNWTWRYIISKGIESLTNDRTDDIIKLTEKMQFFASRSHDLTLRIRELEDKLLAKGGKI